MKRRQAYVMAYYSAWNEINRQMMNYSPPEHCRRLRKAVLSLRSALLNRTTSEYTRQFLQGIMDCMEDTIEELSTFPTSRTTSKTADELATGQQMVEVLLEPERPAPGLVGSPGNKGA